MSTADAVVDATAGGVIVPPIVIIDDDGFVAAAEPVIVAVRDVNPVTLNEPVIDAEPVIVCVSVIALPIFTPVPVTINTLATPTEFDKWKNPIEFKLKRNSLGFIYVASDNPLIFSKVNDF
jgi:hypothetical protein